MLQYRKSRKGISFLQFFRLLFVIFFLYLLGDAFYRWDGFRYYASFSEFLPAVALASILWSLVAIIITLLVWLSVKVTERISQSAGLKIRSEHLLLYLGIFILLGALVWKGKRLIWPDVQTSIQVKFIVFVIVFTISAFLGWLFRNKAERWIGVVEERIKPLVWLFGIWVLISVPLVAYHTWFKEPPKAVSHKFASSVVDKDRPNIILVTFDALTARNMSLYGYYRETTPFISKWAKNASVFTRAEADSNFTSSATASLMTGKRVWTHQLYHLEGSKPVKSEVESLPAELKKSGYYTIAFVVNPHTSVKVLGMENSFNIAPIATKFSTSASLFGWKFGFVEVKLYQLFGDKIRLHNWLLQRDFILNRFINLVSQNFNQTEAPPEKAFNKFLKILDDNPPHPYFVWIHLFPPHDPYLPPEPYKGFFNSSSEFRDYKSQEAVRLESFKYLFKSKPFPKKMQPSVDLLRSYYDEFIRYCDETFKDFIDELRARNKLDNTVIILSSDHGDSFEHSYFTHGGPFLYEQVTHIPLVIREPNQTEGRIIDDLVEQIDIPATILDLADIPVPSWMEGRSLVTLLRGKEFQPMSVFSMNFEENPSLGYQINKGSIAVWEGDYKLIHYLKDSKSLLFNLKQDPSELNNLFDKEPEVGQCLLGLIKENLKKANERIKREQINSKKGYN